MLLFIYGTIFGLLISFSFYFFKKRQKRNYQSRNMMLRVTIKDSFFYLEERLANSNMVTTRRYKSKDSVSKYLEQNYSKNTFLEVRSSGEEKEVSVSSFLEED